MDSYLKGEKGYEKLYVDYLGKAIEVIDRKESKAGNNLYLSLDSGSADCGIQSFGAGDCGNRIFQY